MIFSIYIPQTETQGYKNTQQNKKGTKAQAS
jgi:hypothetical protein